ncbi:MAG: DUF2807 domain-containing protein [Saprospiraceae bacterium]|nr:DUF2807 domain-containing protein [Saprospiraceae bacterium]
MKLSNKISLIAVAIILISTLVVMIKVKMEANTYQKEMTIGNKSWVEIDVPLTAYTIIEAGKHFEVYWHKGNPNAKIRVEENLKDYVKIIQDGQRISIRMDSIQSYRTHEAIRIDLYSDTLTEIYLNNFVEFHMKDTLRLTQLMVSTENHSEGHLLLILDQLELRMNDFSQLKVMGKITNCNIQMDDHTELKAKALETEFVNLNMQDFCEARVHVAKKLIAELSDHAKLVYSGAENLETQIQNREFSEASKSE